MTQEEKILMLKTMSEEENDSLLSTYLFLAKNVIISKAFPFGNAKEMPSKYDGLQIEIAQYMLSKRGAEGNSMRSENGVTVHWEDGDLPPTLLRRIIPCVGVIGGDD